MTATAVPDPVDAIMRDDIEPTPQAFRAAVRAAAEAADKAAEGAGVHHEDAEGHARYTAALIPLLRRGLERAWDEASNNVNRKSAEWKEWLRSEDTYRRACRVMDAMYVCAQSKPLPGMTRRDLLDTVNGLGLVLTEVTEPWAAESISRSTSEES